MSETRELTFEAGYERLQGIAGRLNEDEVPVSEMCDLFAEGKGLERALTAYLDEQRERVEAIERGEGVRAFRIATAGAGGQASAAPSQADAAEPAGGSSLGDDLDFDRVPDPMLDDFGTVPISALDEFKPAPVTARGGPADEDIPF